MSCDAATVPQLAERVGVAAHEVLWHVTGMRKYGEVRELGEDGENPLYALITRYPTAESHWRRNYHGARHRWIAFEEDQASRSMVFACFSCGNCTTVCPPAAESGAFIIALGAIAYDMEVNMFFTFWATVALCDPKKHPIKGFLNKMFGWMLPSSSHALPLSKMLKPGNLLEQSPRLQPTSSFPADNESEDSVRYRRRRHRTLFQGES